MKEKMVTVVVFKVAIVALFPRILPDLDFRELVWWFSGLSLN
jgi:hypothetical protein